MEGGGKPSEKATTVSTQGRPAAQRRYYRASVEFPVTVIVPGFELVTEGSAIDLSAGGMRVLTTSDLAAGQRVALRFALPRHTTEILVHGRVVLSFYDAALARYAHGIAFTQYAIPDLEAIVAFVRDEQH